ncbi:hypothetical protein O988_01048 [Pseudogymnoascus sp. VKM F-3808]|nr:hypothetical protein O988_01048 [Pseudogymnoascus sp. VKM F-3808]
MFRVATASHDVFLRHNKRTETRDASQVLTRVNQQVQIRPIAEAHIRFSLQEYAKADTEHTAAIPQSVMYFRASSL